MKKFFLKLILFGLLLFSFHNGMLAQVTVKYIQPPLNQWHIEDMWNLTIMNTNDKVTIDVFVTVTKSGDGLIIEGTSSPYLLEAHYSGPLSANDLTPVDVNYSGDQNYKEILIKTGTLPEGEYTICVYIKDSGTGAELGQDCIVQQIFPISPPALIWPGDKSQVIDAQPVFTWLLPTPATGDVTYSMRIVEQLDGQGPIEAIESNPSWYQEKDINSTSIQIPVSVREMVPGQKYAWQVSAYIKGDKVGESEVWSFEFGKDFLIRLDSLVILEPDDGLSNNLDYSFSLYITNLDKNDANISVTHIIRTSPNSKSPAHKEDFTPFLLKSGESGMMSGHFYTGKSKIKMFEIGIEATDPSDPSEILAIKEIKGSVLSRPRCDFGDAPDDLSNGFNFPSYRNRNGAQHIIESTNKASLGLITYNGTSPGCVCGGFSADWETDTKQVDNDQKDDGIYFFPQSIYCEVCEIDSIEVTVNIEPGYDRSIKLVLNAWFDFNRDGDWDDCGLCVSTPNGNGGSSRASTQTCEQIKWVRFKQICPYSSGNQGPVNNVSFKIEPSLSNWGNENCATYRLYFNKGFNDPATVAIKDEIWTRFRLTPVTKANKFIIGNYAGQATGGEVEDYPIPCLPTLIEYDYGDAPDELNDPDFHFCTHLKAADNRCFEPNPRPLSNYWMGQDPDPAAHSDFSHEWLGDINLLSCSSNPMSVNAECNGKAIDQEDDGVILAGQFNFPFFPCDTQFVEVMINSSLFPDRYNWDVPIKLHAWFDWNLDGNWDGVFPDCGTTESKEHIKWLSAQVIGPGQAYPEFQVDSYSFDVVPNELSRWPNTGNCQLYRLKFLSGNVITNPSNADTMWCRFRLFFRDFTQPQDVTYSGLMKFGEVEDYPIVPDSNQTVCGPFTDQRDGKVYNAVQIGTQCWMAQNLDVGDQINRSLLQSNNSNIEKYCYNDDPNNCLEYGGLYNWAEAMNYINGADNNILSVLPSGNVQGICPQGWHLPSDDEWCTLENFLEPNIDPAPCSVESWYRGTSIGEKMKETGTNYWDSPSNNNNSNSSQFNGRGGGAFVLAYGSYPNHFVELKRHGHWWTTTQKDAANVYLRHLYSNGDPGYPLLTGNMIGRGSWGSEKQAGASIRCIRN